MDLPGKNLLVISFSFRILLFQDLFDQGIMAMESITSWCSFLLITLELDLVLTSLNSLIHQQKEVCCIRCFQFLSNLPLHHLSYCLSCLAFLVSYFFYSLSFCLQRLLSANCPFEFTQNLLMSSPLSVFLNCVGYFLGIQYSS